uniref:Hypothetical chloroplast protein 29 n=1 Tax=Gastroclonium compressum TaxID=1852973 RepID=A0A173G095_GASCM|nr:hypothetical chloroplast protein 29 [Coeloseira compressa]ANH09706.1 hypothetical chloroplast protein 29 [Coeloseira compressa]
MKKKLLIVDDDISLLNFVSIYLENKGFIVSKTNNVSYALNCMKIDKPDMVLADIMMPCLDGHKFLKILRSDSFFYTVPFIFITGKGMTSDRIYGYNLGCNAYITKPFDPDELLSIINSIFINIEKLANCQHNISKFSINNNIINNLSSMEQSILNLLVQGFMNKEIAHCLNLSVRSVEKYVSKLLHKTNTRNRTELTQFSLLHSNLIKKGE